MPLSIETLSHLAIELQSGMSSQDRFARLINGLRRRLGCDAVALLGYEQQLFRPLATAGLSPDVLGRRFRLAEHPRLEAIARAGYVVRFPANSHLPDPYDGLIPGHERFKVHACIGLPLFIHQTLIGALTLDGMDPHQLDHFSDEELRLVAALSSVALSNALLVERLEKQVLAPVSAGSVSPAVDGDEMIGLSAVMGQLKKEVSIVANSDLNVLITGETGVGKELVARAIHQNSPRAANALIYLNCAALPESVAESELFGHVKGAFTGAIHHRIGKFELADNGTLFLDEIGELSLTLQAKLLRVLQYGDLQRVGDDQSLRVNVRVLAATNRVLKDAVVAGEFRADLFHRLSVFPIHVPPLREREQDIALLAGFFCERSREKLGLGSLVLAPGTLGLLTDNHWPGNVRELEHAIYRATVLARAEQGGGDILLQPQHFALDAARPAADSRPDSPERVELVSLRQGTDNYQRHLIRLALESCGNNWSACARQLAMDPGNLHRLAKRLGIK